MKLLNLSLLCLLLPLLSFAQEYSYTNYNTKEGLTGSTVYCIAQDHEKFLWFGTETGLSRFDGTHFKNFTTADGLPDNEILKLFVDSRNRVWMMPFRHAICYYLKGKIYNAQNDSLLKKIKITEIVRKILEDRNGNILILEAHSYHIIDNDGIVHTTRKIDNEYFTSPDAGINRKGNFEIYVSRNSSGAAFDEWYDGRSHIHEVPSYLKQRLYREGQLYMSSIASDLLAVKKSDSILFYCKKDNEIVGIKVPERFVNMERLNDSLYIINADYRCIIYNHALRQITHEFLRGYKVTAMMQDHEKNYWFATLGEGIFRLGSTAFKNIQFRDKNKLLPVFSIYTIDSNIYVGTDRLLLWVLNRYAGNIQRHRIEPELPEGRIYCLSADSSGKRLLVGTDVGLFLFSDDIKNLFPTTSVKALSVSGNRYLISTSNEVYAKYIDDEEFHDSSRIWRSRATSAAFYNDDYLVGTINGLYKIKANKEIVPFNERYPLLSGRISSIVRADNGIYWIATYGEGIVGFKNDTIFTNISMKDGLSSNSCRNLFIQGNRLWVGTDRGLNKISLDRDKYTITTYNYADGLGSNIINSVYIKDSTIYVGTPAGMTYFKENDVKGSADIFLRITGVNSSDHIWNYDTTGFILPPRNNNIRFEFVGLSFRSAGDIIYKYRLLGLDSSWKTTRETSLSYPSLPSGEYKLQLVAINKFGIASEMESIAFEIEERLLQKTWVRMLLLLIIVAIIWGAVRLYIKRIERKQKQEAAKVQKMTELEQMALRSQMNPHFIFNSLNSIQQYVMEKDIAGANRVITGFSSLMRQTLDFSSKQEITLTEELQYLSTYLELEKVRMENKFEYEVQVEPGLKEDDYYVPSMFLQPFVENSIRHGIRYRKDKSGFILITVKVQDGKLICIVEDNGVGREVAGHYKKDFGIQWTSKGMSLTADRIEMFNKINAGKIEMMIDDLMDEAGNPLGTRVTIKFPVYYG
jgi:ligand-binding sensor domain-containing protein/two-component sensor histidine kinase